MIHLEEIVCSVYQEKFQLIDKGEWEVGKFAKICKNLKPPPENCMSHKTNMIINNKLITT